MSQLPPSPEQSAYGTRADATVAAAVPGAATESHEFLAEVPLHERLLMGYLGMLFLLAASAPALHHGGAMLHTGANLGAGLLSVAIVRGRLLGNRIIEALIARSVILVCLGVSFAQLTELFAVRGAANLDEALLRFDLATFGFEPTLIMDRWVTPALVEWFSFFYFGYYFLLIGHILPIGYLGRDARMVHEFALGITMTFCAGHLLYFAVPGLGPFSLPVFKHTLQGGYWWGLVSTTVQSAGMRKDIFPSLHTAVPTFITLFSWRRRATAPFRWTWIPVGLFTSQIILATMFLRWHYVIDVCAGLTLATTASFLAARIARAEWVRRETLALSEPMPSYGGRPRSA